MPNEKQIVRVLTEPTIILDDLQFLDAEEGTSQPYGRPTSAYKPSKQYGGAFPLAQVNDYPFAADQIFDMRISSRGERPTINMHVLIRDKSFYSTSFPKDGDLVSVFIRGMTEPFKPIRNDYEITSVYIDNPPGSGENDYDTMRISGVLRIPGYDAVKCFSTKGTSMKAMMKAANDLKLGFATNEVDTADSQVWICPNEKVKDFLRDTTLAAWKDEKSFFSYFIDHYYYLNFVNVEPLYGEKAEIEDAIAVLRMFRDYGKDMELAKSLTKTVLSNWDDIGESPFYISQHSLINNTSSINLRHGYKRYAQYYDGLIRENQSFFVDPKTTEGSERTKQLLKGRPNEDFYLKQINTKWMGVQYGKDGENCHPKYNYSKVTNFQNNIHLEKMGLSISLSTPNFNLRRMQTVPVVIVIKKDTIRKRYNEPVDETESKSLPNENEPNRTKSALDFNESPFNIDKTMSGFYTIHSIDYVYEKGHFHQECTLFRREWPTPPQTY